VGNRAENESKDKSERDDQACEVGEVFHQGDQRIQVRKKILALRRVLALRRECGRELKIAGATQRTSSLFSLFAFG
jgi:hypothetical protein